MAVANARSTQQLIEVLYLEPIPTTAARSTQQLIEVIYVPSPPPAARSTQQLIEVLYTELIPIEESVTSTLTITQEVGLQAVPWRLSAAHTLSLSDEVFRWEDPGSTLALSDSATAALILTIDVTQNLNLTQSTIVAGDFVRALSDNVNLTHLVGQEFSESVAHTITFTQDTHLLGRAPSHLLALTQVAIGLAIQLGGAVDSTITLAQTVGLDLISNQSALNALVLSDAITTANVFLRSASNTLSLDDLAQPTFSASDLIFQAPCPGIERTIQLPKPLLQDGENLVSQLEQSQTVDGTLFTYVKRLTDRRLDYTFSLTRAKAREFQAFIDLYNGEEWKMINWKGEVWKVKLVTNPVQFTATRRSAPDGAGTDVSITLEGRKLFG